MPFFDNNFSGFLTGLNGQIDEARAYNRKQAELQDARESAIFNSLANSDDPDIRAAAVTGLLTGKSPGKFFDRYLGKMQEHPSFQQIRELVGSGHQAFPGETEGTRRKMEATTGGQITGRVSGAVRGAHDAGADLAPDQIRRVAMGATGAAQGRAPALQKVVITRKDGTTTGGYFNPDPSNPGFYDDDGNPIDDVVSYQNTATAARTGSTGVGAKWQTMSAADYRRQYGDNPLLGSVPPGTKIQARISADGKSASDPVLVTAPPVNPNFSFSQTNQGIVNQDTHTGAVRLAPGGAGLSAPTPPATSAGAVRALQDGILRMHPMPKGLLGTGPSPAERQRWQTAVDAEAQRYNYPDFASLQAAVAQETGQVQDRVPPATPPPPAVTPAPGTGGGRGGRGRGRVATPPTNAADPLGILNR